MTSTYTNIYYLLFELKRISEKLEINDNPMKRQVGFKSTGGTIYYIGIVNIKRTLSNPKYDEYKEACNRYQLDPLSPDDFRMFRANVLNKLRFREGRSAIANFLNSAEADWLTL